MRKFENLADLFEMLDKLTDDDEVTAVEIEVKEHEPAEKKKEEKKDKKEALLEEARQEALEAKKRIVEKEGEEHANNVIRYAAICASVRACTDLDIPIREDMFKEYNELCEKVHPDRCNPFLLPFAYMMIDSMKEEGVKSLE